MSEDVYIPNVIELDSLTLVNFEGKQLDIKELMLELNLFYDLTGKGIVCNIVLLDAVGAIELLPIVGEENVYINFKSTGSEAKELVFNVYNIEGRQEQGRTETYTLNCVSAENMLNHRRSVNQAFTGMTATDAISAIYNNYLKPNDADSNLYKKKDLTVLPAKNNVHAVFSDITPFEAIDYLIQEAQSQNDTSSSYIFYENNDGWNLDTFDSLLKTEPVETFYYGFANIEYMNDTGNGKEIFKPWQQIESLDHVKDLNILEDLRNGLFNHSVEAIDPIRKKFNKQTFSYKDDSNQLGQIDKHKLVRDESIYSTREPTSVNYLIVSNLGDKYSDNPGLSADDPQIANPRKLHKFMKFDIANRLKLTNNIVNITIPGNTELELGNIINIKTVLNNIVEENKTKETSPELVNEKYMIMSMRHIYNKINDNFMTVLECVRDSYGKEIQAGS